jgi:hypothetical protein
MAELVIWLQNQHDALLCGRACGHVQVCWLRFDAALPALLMLLTIAVQVIWSRALGTLAGVAALLSTWLLVHQA